MAERLEGGLHGLRDIDGAGRKTRRVRRRVRALEEVEVDGVGGRQRLGGGLDEGEAVGRVGGDWRVEAEERGAGEEGGDGGIGV